ncbi:MAG TPA: hypothetical protein PK060_05155, partial [Polaromonas sp.]|uniref:hypothetical protein n=1 Tax=unclassified Polaromonas TaxID=2638319 RepID=UPI0025CC39BF
VIRRIIAIGCLLAQHFRQIFADAFHKTHVKWQAGQPISALLSSNPARSPFHFRELSVRLSRPLEYERIVKHQNTGFKAPFHSLHRGD